MREMINSCALVITPDNYSLLTILDGKSYLQGLATAQTPAETTISGNIITHNMPQICVGVINGPRARIIVHICLFEVECLKGGIAT